LCADVVRLQLQHFQKFDDTTVALSAITGSIEGKIPKPLKKILKKISDDSEESLLVADSKLGSSIKVRVLPLVGI
jgi:nucleolar protein 58